MTCRPGPLTGLAPGFPSLAVDLSNLPDRQRLDRALEYLRRLGLRASGDIEPGDVYRAVRKEAARGDYARVLFLVHDRPSWRSRLAGRGVIARLRRALDIPVDVPGRPDLAPPSP